MADVVCAKMDAARRPDAFQLLNQFLREDEFYLEASAAYGDSGSEALARALDLMLEHPETGFVWLGYVAGKPATVCVVCYAISTSLGARVAKLDDVYGPGEWQRQGLGTAMLQALARELRSEGVGRIDTAVHLRNQPAYRLYEKLGFLRLE